MSKIIYAGDYNKAFNFKSLGDFILSSLKNGGDEIALVSKH